MSGRSAVNILRHIILARHATGSCASYEYVIHVRLVHADLIFLPVLVSGWSDNGWLSGGHAVRMAMEICMSRYISSRTSSHFHHSDAQGVAGIIEEDEGK